MIVKVYGWVFDATDHIYKVNLLTSLIFNHLFSNRSRYILDKPTLSARMLLSFLKNTVNYKISTQSQQINTDMHYFRDRVEIRC